MPLIRPAALATVAILTACTTPTQIPPGDIAVYTHINQATNCTDLQDIFDTAETNNKRASQQPIDKAEMDWTLAYMQAANQRMNDLGC